MSERLIRLSRLHGGTTGYATNAWHTSVCHQPALPLTLCTNTNGPRTGCQHTTQTQLKRWLTEPPGCNHCVSNSTFALHTQQHPQPMTQLSPMPDPTHLTTPLKAPQWGQPRWRLHWSSTRRNSCSRGTRSSRGLRNFLQDPQRSMFRDNLTQHRGKTNAHVQNTCCRGISLLEVTACTHARSSMLQCHWRPRLILRLCAL